MTLGHPRDPYPLIVEGGMLLSEAQRRSRGGLVAGAIDADLLAPLDRTDAVAQAHGLHGNRAVLEALSGGPTGLDGMIGVAVASALGGLFADVPGATSLSAMRDALSSSIGADPAGAVKRSAGFALPSAVRAAMEAAFGVDFGAVRIHTDGAAQRAADDLNAHAFALGAHVFFGRGEFAPGTPDGDRLIAHELTHVVQHFEGRLAGQSGVSSPSDPVEREAYANESIIVGRLAAVDAGPVESATADVGLGDAALRAESETGAGSDGEGEQAGSAEGDLAARCDAATAADVGSVLADVAASEDLQSTVDQLEADGSLAALMKVAGEVVYDDDTAFEDFAAITALREPTAAIATFVEHLDLPANRDRTITTARAERIHTILKAMPVDLRTQLFTSEDGQQAFELVDGCASVQLRLQAGFGFFDGNYDNLLAELEDLGTWDPAQEGHLRAMFWMLVQAGYADDETVRTFVRHNWDLATPMFQELGFHEDGGFDLEEARTTPEPRRVRLQLGKLWQSIKHDRIGGIGLVGHYLFDSIGKRSSVEGIDLSLLQEGLGGQVGGIVFGRPDGEGAPEISLTMDEVAGSLSIVGESLPLDGLSSNVLAEDGSTYSVVAKSGQASGLAIDGTWDQPGGAPDRLSIRFETLSLQGLVIAAAGVTTSIESTEVRGLVFEGNLAVASKDDPKALQNLLDEIVAAVSAAVQLLYTAVAAVLDARTATQGGKVDPSEWRAALESTLEALGGDGKVAIGWDGLDVGAVETNDGQRVDGVHTGAVAVTVKAGARTAAWFEVERMVAAAEHEGRGFTADEVERLGALQEILSGPPLPGIDEELLARIGVDLLRLDVTVKDAAEATAGAQVDALRVVLEQKTGADGEVEQQAIVSDDGFDVQIEVPGDGDELVEVEVDAPDLELPDGLDLGSGFVGPLELEGAHGSASVDASGTVTLEGVGFDHLEIDGFVWSDGSMSARAEGAVTVSDVSLDAVLPGHPGAGVQVDELQIERLHFGAVAASTLVAEAAGEWSLAITGGELVNIELTGFDGGGIFGKSLAALTIESGKLGGLDAAMSGISVGGEALSVGAVKVGGGDAAGYAFSLDDVLAGELDVEAAGHSVVFTDSRVDSIHGETDADGVDVTLDGVDADIQADGFGIDVKGDVRFDFSGNDLSIWATLPTVTVGAFEVAGGGAKIHASKIVAPNLVAVVKMTFPSGGGAPSWIGVTRLEAPSIDIDGLVLDLPDKGIRVSLPRGTAHLQSFSLEGLSVVVGTGSYLSWLKKGDLDIASVDVSGLEIATATGVTADGWASTGAIHADVSDGDVSFSIDDPQMAVEGASQSEDGSYGEFDVEQIGADVIEGSVGEDGVSATVRGIRVEHVVWDDGNVNLDIDWITCDVLLGGQAAEAQERIGELVFPGALQSLVPEVAAKQVLGLENIEFGFTRLVIDDARKLSGGTDSEPTDLADVARTWFGSARALADALSGHIQINAEAEASRTSGVELDIDHGEVTGSVFGLQIPGGARLYERENDSDLWFVETERGVQVSVLGFSHEVSVDSIAAAFTGDPDAEPSVVVERMKALDWNFDVDLAVRPTKLKLPGLGTVDVGHLFEAGEPPLKLVGDGSTGAGAELSLNVALNKAVANDVKGMQLELHGIEVEDTVDVKVDFEGLSPTRIEATLVGARIGRLDASVKGKGGGGG